MESITIYQVTANSDKQEGRGSQTVIVSFTTEAQALNCTYDQVFQSKHGIMGTISGISVQKTTLSVYDTYGEYKDDVSDEEIYKTAIAKLTKEEKRVLGL